MTRFEDVRNIECVDASGRHIVIIEQKKWPKYSLADRPVEPVIDYMTADGEVATKFGDDFLLLLTDEVFHVALSPE